MTSTTSDIGGVALHHRFDGPGDGPVVVLSNSLGTSLEMWDDQVAALATRRRVLRYDYRGHGSSSVPPGPYSLEDLGNDLLGLLDHLDLERVDFCGLSLGGLIGIWLGARAPERIERLVLSCTSPSFGTAEMWLERAADVRREGMDAVVDGILERWFTPEFKRQRPDRFAWMNAMLRATPPEGYAACCEAIAGRDLDDALPSIQAPTQLICGSDDPTSPPELAARMQQSIPAAELVVIRGARHLANVERPAEFTAAVTRHLDHKRVES
jgi:3-oxoadipate enol-lactonase